MLLILKQADDIEKKIHLLFEGRIFFFMQEKEHSHQARTRGHLLLQLR